MLELIRKYANSIVVKIFLTILAGSFFLFFGFSYIVDRIKGRDYVIKIANTKISPQAFKIERMKKLEMLQRISPNKVDDSQVSAGIVHQLVWDNIIDLAAQDNGLIVTDSTMYDYIKNLDMFRTEDGRFNAAHLRAFLQKIQVPESIFLESQKREIKSHILKHPLRYVSVLDELDVFINAEFEKRSINVAKIDPAKIQIKDVPSAEDLEEFYAANSEQFMAPETRSFKILSFAESDIEKTIKITESDLQEAYEMSDQKDDRSFDDMKSELRAEIKQEKLNAIIEDMTRSIEDALTAGNSAETVAQENGLNIISVENVSLDDAKKIKLPFAQDVLTVAFGTEEKESSYFSESFGNDKKVVQWLVYVEKIVPKHVQDLQKIEKKVRDAWMKDQRHQKALAIANELIESFKTSSKVNAKDITKTALFDRKATIDTKNNEHKKLVAQVCDNAFLMDKNDIASEEIDGIIYVYYLDKVENNSDEVNEKRHDGYLQLISENANDMYQQMIGYLSKKYEVKVNYEMLKESDNNVDLKTVESEIF